MRLCFIENLTVRSFLLSVLPSLLWRLATRRQVAICYVIASSRTSMAVATAIAPLTGTRVQRLDFRLIDVRDENGLLVRLRLPFQDLVRVQREITSEPVFRQVLDKFPERHSATVFLAKAALGSDSRARVGGGLWRALFLIEVCAWQRRNIGSLVRDVTLFIERRPWMAQIVAFGSRADVTVVAVGPAINLISLRVWLRQALGLRRILMIRGLLHAFSARRRPTATKQGSSGIKRSPGGDACVVVQHYGHLNLRRKDLHSDLFFWQQASLPASQLLVSFSLVSDPLDAEKMSELRQFGIHAVALDPRVAQTPGVEIFSPRPSFHRRERPPSTVAHAGRTREFKFLNAHVTTYREQRKYWTEFFQRYAAKAYVSWYHADGTNVVIADAIRCLGGVAIIYQRSFDSLPSPDCALATDIAFGFSMSGPQREAQSGSIVPYYVVTGYLGDHRFRLLQERARELRQMLHRHGATRIVSFFDENSADDPRWHTGHELQREGYAYLCEKVLREPWLGLVLKPKVPATLRRRLGPVADLLARAEATGRCYLFDSGRLQGSYPPAAAALISDVAVHGHLSSATAGVEAALAGVPTLLLDREGWHISPLYRLGPGVVFRDCESLWQALTDHFRSPTGVPGLGDWAPMLDELDPFRDGRAAERMGTYVRWLTEGFNAGLDRETVMADAAERYGLSWGFDKVCSVGTGRVAPLHEARAFKEAVNQS